MDKEKLKNEIFIGIVEDNNDPRKLGRVRVRVFNVFEEIPKEDLPWAFPWKDLNGNQFSVPEIGKIVSVVFDQGNIYEPQFIYADHYNTNLENKLNSLSGEDYTSMKAIMFDHSTQIFRTPSEGLKIDHEYSNINLDPNGNILLNLRDNKSVLTLGSSDADEEAVLGTTFMRWFDSLIENLLGAKGGPYLGNAGAPVLPNPAMTKVLTEYKSLRRKFLSQHIRLSKNDNIIPQSRPYVNQQGDGVNATVQPGTEQPSSMYYNEATGQMESYQSLPAASGNPALFNPSDYAEAVSYDIPTTTIGNSKYQNGRIPDTARKVSLWANGDKKGKWISSNITRTDAAKLTTEASNAFDALFDLYEKSNFDGKAKLVITDGYRSYQNQVSLKAKMGSFAATPGTSNHGWGLAMDISGIANPIGTLKNNKTDRASAYRTPTYKWLFANSWKFGIYSPVKLRDDVGSVDEWWHFEYQGNKGAPAPLIDRYAQVFTRADVAALRRNGVSIFTPPSNI